MSNDTAGDRTQGILTIANSWGKETAFGIVWGLMGTLIASIAIALLLLPMAHPLIFFVFSTAMMVSVAIALLPYQQQGSVSAYEGFVFWDRMAMLLGVVGLLGTAPAFS